MDEKEQSIIIFSGVEAWDSLEARRGLKDAIQNAAGKVSEVAVATMQENMRRFLHALSIILCVPSEQIGELTLDTIEISVQIDGKGNIGITGVGAAELAAHGGIKLILRKKN